MGLGDSVQSTGAETKIGTLGHSCFKDHWKAELELELAEI